MSPSVQARAALRARLGISSRVLSSDEVRELEPDVSPAIRAGLFCPDDGVAFHEKNTLAYAALAREAGAVLREGSRRKNCLSGMVVRLAFSQRRARRSLSMAKCCCSAMPG